jgi:hypothetical protein
MFNVVYDTTRGYVLQCYSGSTSFQVGAMNIGTGIASANRYFLKPKHTKMFWFKLSALPTGGDNPNFISCGNAAGDTSIQHYVFIGAGTNNALVTHVNGVNNVTCTISAGVWTHYASTYDGSTLTVYINGSAAGSVTDGKAFSDNQGTFIGGIIDGGSTNNTFFGCMDKIRIYSSDLTDIDIRNIYKFENANPTM